MNVTKPPLAAQPQHSTASSSVGAAATDPALIATGGHGENATVGDVVAVIERAYPPKLAESWDACGLVCGDPSLPAQKVAIALDCTDAVADAAITGGADFLLVHHPPLLRGVTGIPVTHPKGRIIHQLIRAGVALYAAHTSADAARPGVNDRLAEMLGVFPGAPLTPVPAGVDPATATGIGRVGDLDTPMTLAEFTHRVAQRLPRTRWGVRAAGDPERIIHRVAVASGAGDGFLSTVLDLDVDCFVTSDLRHHPVDEHLRAGGCAVIDTAHWASEFPWCSQAAELLNTADPRLSAEVIDIRTDPWTLHANHTDDVDRADRADSGDVP